VIRGRFNFFIAALLALGLSISALAQQTPTQKPSQTPQTAPQTQQVLPSYEGQNVSSVELAGRPDVNPADYAPLLVQRPGEPFTRAKVDQTIAALKRTGKFHDVQLEVWPELEGVRVILVLQPAMYFGVFEFPGALSRFAYSQLLQITNYPPRGEYTHLDVQRAKQALETFFKRSGYFLSQVQAEVRPDAKHGLVNVIFHSTLKQRAKFGEVQVTGTSQEQAQQLQSALHSLRARLRGAAIRQGKTYKYKTLRNATEYLQNALAKKDYLSAQVQLAGAKYDPESNRADVSFNVQPGPLVHVKVEGAHVWSWTQRKLLPIYQQLGLNPELIQEGRQNLISHFQSKGFFDVKVDSYVKSQSPGETIVYRIEKGPRHKVADVSITGNHHLPEKQLRAVLKVQKARLFSHGTFSEKAVRTTVKNLKSVYQASGFSDVKITPQVTTQDRNVIVTFRIDEGPQDIVSALRIEGNTALSEAQFAPHGLKLTPGKPYSQKFADEDRNEIIAQYLRQGFLTATFRGTARKLPDDPHKLEVVYNIHEGPQVYTATIVTLGRKDTQQKLINHDVTGISVGRPLQENALLESETRLYTRGVFDWAQVDPRRQITTQSQEDVIVKVHEAKRNTLTYGFGFEVINRGGNIPSGTVAVPGLPPIGLPSNFTTSEKTFWGPRGTIEYTRNNLFGKAASFTFTGLAGRLDQNGSVLFTDPLFRWSSWTENISLVGEHNTENPIFNSRQGQIGYELRRPLDAKKTKTLSFRYSFNVTGLSNLLIPELVPPQDRHVRLSTLSSSYIRETRDSPLDAHKGIYQSYEVDINPIALGSNFSFAKLLTQTAYYKQIPFNIVWANSLRIGLEQSFSGSEVPISEKFFSGGGSTLRGFPLNGAGPQNTIPACGNPDDPSTCSLIQVPVGGNQLLIINSELRIPVPIKKGLGIAAFYDGGNVFERIGFHDFAANYTNSIGIGLRYATPVGPIRIDVGHNLNALPGIKATQIFITLGQAF
jgi:outer membrane protein assembly factor BamA